LLHDELLYLPPRATKDISLDISTANVEVIIIINLFLGAYYKLELQGDLALAFCFLATFFCLLAFVFCLLTPTFPPRF
jgi:hypothetical protein